MPFKTDYVKGHFIWTARPCLHRGAPKNAYDDFQYWEGIYKGKKRRWEIQLQMQFLPKYFEEQSPWTRRKAEWDEIYIDVLSRAI